MCIYISLCNTPIFANLQYNRKPLLPVSVLSPTSLQHTHFRCSLSLQLTHLCKLPLSSFPLLNLSRMPIPPQHVYNRKPHFPISVLSLSLQHAHLCKLPLSSFLLLNLSRMRIPPQHVYNRKPLFPISVLSLSLCNTPIYANYPFHLFRFSISPECLFLHSMCTIGSPSFPFRCSLSLCATRPFMQITLFIFFASQSLQNAYSSIACVQSEALLSHFGALSLSTCNTPIYANYPFHLFRFSISPECLFLHSMCIIGSPSFPFRCSLSLCNTPIYADYPFHLFRFSISPGYLFLQSMCIYLSLSFCITPTIG